MRLTPLIVPVSIAVMVFIGGIAVWKYSKKTTQTSTFIKTTAENDQKKVEDALANNHPEDAILILEQYLGDIGTKTPIANKWLALNIQTASMIRDGEHLTKLYTAYPEVFEKNEEASLLVAENLLANNDFETFEKLRSSWKGKETMEPNWLVIDAFLFEQQKRKTEAVDLLKSKTFEGSKDTLRLVKLALLNYPENPEAAWEYLNAAAQKDPKNPDIRIYRAKLLESVGKQGFALSEYIDAVALSPKNPMLKDEVAEFFLRQKDYGSALAIWAETLKETSTDSIWIKTIFWSHVAVPLKIDFEQSTIPENPTKPLITYLLSLPPDTFWDFAGYEKVPNAQKYLNTLQSTLWLRVLQNLKEGHETKAAELLKYNPFRTISINPELQLALRQILNQRLEGNLSLESSSNEITSLQKMMNSIDQAIPIENLPFFNLLEKMAGIESGEKIELSDLAKKTIKETENLIKSPIAYASALLAAGWNEAAIILLGDRELPSDIPDWVSFGFTNAIKFNRSPKAALEFALKQKSFAELDLLKAELYIDQKLYPEALSILRPLLEEKGPNAERAIWMTSMIYLEEKNYDAAKTTLNSSNTLKESVGGKELAARIELAQGNEKQAIEIYQSIADKSPEAKSYFARKAFSEKDWDKARRLTEELLKDYPVNLTLRQNLKKIIEEQDALKKSGNTAAPVKTS